MQQIDLNEPHLEKDAIADFSCEGSDGSIVTTSLEPEVVSEGIWELVLPPREAGEICRLEVN